MTIEEFKAKIVEYNVPERLYSLNDGVKLDALILYQNYSIWEVFYRDEMNCRHDLGVFRVQTEALDFLWMKFEHEVTRPQSKFVPRYNP